MKDSQLDNTSEFHPRIRLHCVSYELRNRIVHQQILDEDKGTLRCLQSQVPLIDDGRKNRSVVHS